MSCQWLRLRWPCALLRAACAPAGAGLRGLCGRSSRQGPLRCPSPRLRLRAAPASSLPPLTAHPRRPDRPLWPRSPDPIHSQELSVHRQSTAHSAALGREFFSDASLFARIRQRLIGAYHRSGRVLIDYLLTPTEIHVVAQVESGDSAGGIARAFGNVVSRWVREVHPVRSPVLAGPYRAQRIASVDDLRREVRMLAWRAVYLGHCATPTHYARGALRIALGRATAKGFNARPLLLHFGGPIPEARAALARWIRHRPTELEWRAWELTRGLQLATGSIGPRASMARVVEGPAAALIAAGGTYDIDGALALLEIWVATKIRAVGSLNLHDAPGAGGARGRALVACLAVTHRLCSAASVARYFGRAKSTLSEQMAACRARLADRSILHTPVSRILEESVAVKSTLRPKCLETTEARRGQLATALSYGTDDRHRRGLFFGYRLSRRESRAGLRCGM